MKRRLDSSLLQVQEVFQSPDYFADPVKMLEKNHFPSPIIENLGFDKEFFSLIKLVIKFFNKAFPEILFLGAFTCQNELVMNDFFNLFYESYCIRTIVKKMVFRPETFRRSH